MGRVAPTSIDRDTVVRWLTDLCGCDTTTGHEDRGLDVLRRILTALGAEVELQSVAADRSNVLARWGRPRVLFATHTDTVPPFVPPSVGGGVIRGRGACDAKGQTVAQLAAIGRMLEEGVRELAWLGVVGEETDSVGARRAVDLRPRLEGCTAVVVGEPTGCRLATGQRGIAHYRLEVRGRAAHSSLAMRGRNAILELLDWIGRLRELDPASDPDLGPESWNLGSIEGGTRVNVVPDLARAELLVRPVPGSGFDERLRALAPPDATVDLVQETPAVRFPEIGGFERAPVPFGSDAPRLRVLAVEGRVALVGPGRIDVAHSPDEEITFDELEAGIALNVRLARHLLGEAP